MEVAIYLTQMASFMQLGAHGAWAMEVSMFYFLTAVIIVFLGSGKYAVMRDFMKISLRLIYVGI